MDTQKTNVKIKEELTIHQSEGTPLGNFLTDDCELDTKYLGSLVGMNIKDVKNNRVGKIECTSRRKVWAYFPSIKNKDKTVYKEIFLAYPREVEKYAILNSVDSVQDEVKEELDIKHGKSINDLRQEALVGWEEYTNSIKKRLADCGYTDIYISKIYPKRKWCEWYLDDYIVKFKYKDAEIRAYVGGDFYFYYGKDVDDYVTSTEELEEFGVFDDKSWFELVKDLDSDGVDEPWTDNSCHFGFTFKIGGYDTDWYELGYEDPEDLDELIDRLTDVSQIDKDLQEVRDMWDIEYPSESTVEEELNVNTSDDKFRVYNDSSLNTRCIEITDKDIIAEVKKELKTINSFSGAAEQINDSYPIRMWSHSNFGPVRSVSAYCEINGGKWVTFILKPDMYKFILEKIDLDEDAFNSIMIEELNVKTNDSADKPWAEGGIVLTQDETGREHDYVELTNEQCQVLDALVPGSANDADIPEDAWGELYRNGKDVWCEIWTPDDYLCDFNNLTDEWLSKIGLKREDIPDIGFDNAEEMNEYLEKPDGNVVIDKHRKTRWSMYLNNKLIGRANVSDTGYLYYFEVNKNYRNKGYGTLMFEKLLQEGVFWLHVERDNTEAQKFYEKFGFVKFEGTEHDYCQIMFDRDRKDSFVDLYNTYDGNVKHMLGNLSRVVYPEIVKENGGEGRSSFENGYNVSEELVFNKPSETKPDVNVDGVCFDINEEIIRVGKDDITTKEEIISLILKEEDDWAFGLISTEKLAEKLAEYIGNEWFICSPIIFVKDAASVSMQITCSQMSNVHVRLFSVNPHRHGLDTMIAIHNLLKDKMRINFKEELMLSPQQGKGYVFSRMADNYYAVRIDSPDLIDYALTELGFNSENWYANIMDEIDTVLLMFCFNYDIADCWILINNKIRHHVVVMDDLKKVLNNIDANWEEKIKENNLDESKEDKAKFSSWANDAELVKKFYKNVNRLEDKDIYSWMKKSPDDLRTALNNLDKTNSEKEREAKKGAKLIAQDDNWFIYKINTVEAAQYYGKNTKWCISGEDTGTFDLQTLAYDKKEAIDNIKKLYKPDTVLKAKQDEEWDDVWEITVIMNSGTYYFNHYKEEEGASFYFCISKLKNKECFGNKLYNKIAIQKSTDYMEITIYNSLDDEIKVSDIPNNELIAEFLNSIG